MLAEAQQKTAAITGAWQPVHVFPIAAQPDGVLRHAGFADTCSDLPALAGRVPAGAYAMLLDDDGDLMRGAALLAFAQRHGLPAVSVSGLIHDRLLTEGALRRTRWTQLATPYACSPCMPTSRRRAAPSPHISRLLTNSALKL